METGIAGTPSKDECNLAMLAHLLGIFTSVIGALVIWLVKRDSSTFVAQESVEALNFQITLAIGWVIASILTVILIGNLLFPLLILANVVFCILAALATSKGTGYRYPFALRLVS